MFIQHIDEDQLIKEVQYYATLYYSGSYGMLVSSKSWYYNGVTYLTGVENTTTNNSPIIIKYTHSNGLLEFEKVGTIDNYDAGEHSHPALIIKDGFIYVYQVNGHGKEIKVWKSNVAESISDGFTFHFTIPGNYGYCNPRLYADGRVVVMSRLTLHPGTEEYSQVLNISAPNDYTLWTKKIITQSDYSTYGNRHYPAFPFEYGTNSWIYGGVTLRNDIGLENYFGQCIWKTTDFITFYNLTETFSKNIDTLGAISRQELEDHFTLFGTNTNMTGYVKPLQFIVIDDVVYSSYFDETEGYFRFYKVDSLGNLITYPLQIQGIDTIDNGSFKFTIYYNGNNLLVLVNGKIYGFDLNFSNMTFFDQYNYAGDVSPLNAAILPWNLPEVSGDYMIAGSTEEGSFPYIITDNKFLI